MCNLSVGSVCHEERVDRPLGFVLLAREGLIPASDRDAVVQSPLPKELWKSALEPQKQRSSAPGPDSLCLVRSKVARYRNP